MRLLLLILSSCLSWATSAAMPHAEHAEHQHHTMQPNLADARDPFAWSDPQASLIKHHHPTLISAVLVHHLEWRPQPEQLALDLTAWIGSDDQRLVIRGDVERQVFAKTNQTWSVNLWQPIDAFWNREIGVVVEDHNDVDHWLSLGVTGLSPYWVELGAWLWINQDGQTQVRLDAEYEARLNQTWALYPAARLKAYGQDAPNHQQWAGLAALGLSMRLAYQPQRWLAPYIGIDYERTLGETAKQLDQRQNEWQGLIGIRVWY